MGKRGIRSSKKRDQRYEKGLVKRELRVVQENIVDTRERAKVLLVSALEARKTAEKDGASLAAAATDAAGDDGGRRASQEEQRSALKPSDGARAKDDGKRQRHGGDGEEARRRPEGSKRHR